MEYANITVTDQQNRLFSVDATFAITRHHTIIVTPLVGQAGNVKEYVQAEDYQIDITITVGKEHTNHPAYRQYPCEPIRN